MSDYGDQWRERRQHRASKVIGYCLCGGRLMANQQFCPRCENDNPYYKPKEPKK